MYGAILRLDSGRQNRIDPDGFLSLFSRSAQKKIKKADTRLNSNRYADNPFTPSLTRFSMYPDYFRGTDLRTLFWKLKNFPDLRDMTRVFINQDNSVVFEFSQEVTEDMHDSLIRILRGFGHVEFTNPQVSGKRIGFDVQQVGYPE